MNEQICVVGLGYVGLPLAVALARHYRVTGFDVKAERIAELRAGHDRTGEVQESVLNGTQVHLTSDLADITDKSIYIITVPTPVDEENRPDLSMVRAACQTVGHVIPKTGAIVVVELTVYPGVTEEICGPIIAAASGLVCGRDFFLGYSPERINPGDREHTVERITKVVAGQTPDATRRLAAIYGAVTTGGTFIAHDIRTAEAAKVIENAQRDINIAFINEVTMIFNRMGLSVYDVLEAARTKWNFLGFTPGLVGGHCIGVDPFYLADSAQRLGLHPEVILAGRRVNDGMGTYVADSINAKLATEGKGKSRRILVLGITFKENVPDLRNSKVVDVIRGLHRHGHQVEVHDPVADPAEARREYGVEIFKSLGDTAPYDCVVGAVAHDSYRAFTAANLIRLMTSNAMLADVKGMWRHLTFPRTIVYWQL